MACSGSLLVEAVGRKRVEALCPHHPAGRGYDHHHLAQGVRAHAKPGGYPTFGNKTNYSLLFLLKAFLMQKNTNGFDCNDCTKGFDCNDCNCPRQDSWEIVAICSLHSSKRFFLD